MEKLSSVILVDDDSTTNYLNEALVRSLGLTDTVVVAENGEEALAMLGELAVPPTLENPTLLLLDMTMPTMGGIPFLEAYQNLPAAQREAIRIIVLTVSMNSENLARINELPIAGLASKPLTAEKLDTILQLHFQRSL